jgi:hypothetical protein
MPDEVNSLLSSSRFNIPTRSVQQLMLSHESTFFLTKSFCVISNILIE